MQINNSFSTHYVSRLKTKIKISKPARLLALICALVIQNAYAAPTELFMSEYIEGSSFNKAIEIYNGTGAPIDLAAGGYSLEIYNNGATTPNATESLTGVIADGDVYVLSNAGAALPGITAQSDATSSVINFNGDDALVFKKGGVVIDSFGQVGTDPGSEWPNGGQNAVLSQVIQIQRMLSIPPLNGTCSHKITPTTLAATRHLVLHRNPRHPLMTTGSSMKLMQILRVILPAMQMVTAPGTVAMMNSLNFTINQMKKKTSVAGP
jgi:hypothetical protein